MAKETKQIHGWKWQTIEEFNAASDELNTFYNLPNEKGDIFMVEKSSKNEDDTIDFYYVGKNKQIAAVFGKSTKFDIKRDDT